MIMISLLRMSLILIPNSTFVLLCGYAHTVIRFGPVPKIRKPAGSNFFLNNTFSSRFSEYIFQPVPIFS